MCALCNENTTSVCSWGCFDSPHVLGVSPWNGHQRHFYLMLGVWCRLPRIQREMPSWKVWAWPRIDRESCLANLGDVDKARQDGSWGYLTVLPVMSFPLSLSCPVGFRSNQMWKTSDSEVLWSPRVRLWRPRLGIHQSTNHGAIASSFAMFDVETSRLRIADWSTGDEFCNQKSWRSDTRIAMLSTSCLSHFLLTCGGDGCSAVENTDFEERLLKHA